MSFFGDAAKKAVELTKEFNQLTVRMEANDREVHRMIEEFKRLIDKFEAKQQIIEQQLVKANQDLVARVSKLEALVEATLRHASMVSAKEGAKEAVKEAIANSRVENLDGPAENLARAVLLPDKQ